MKTAALRPISARIATRLAGFFLLTALSGVSVVLPSPAVLAQQPSGATIVAGTATFATNGNTFTVTNSPNAIINWQSFNIGAGKTTRFEQLSPSSTVMNRVVEANPSVILGSLTSNGNVFLVNPNGILFGAGSRVDVGGLVASTLALSDSNFLAGNFQFKATTSSGALNVDGIITTGTGYLGLIAPRISIGGSVSGGSAGIAAGNEVSLSIVNGQEVSVVVNSGIDTGGNTLGAINLSGSLTFAEFRVIDQSMPLVVGGSATFAASGGTIDNQGGNGGAVSGGTVQGGSGGVAATGGVALGVTLTVQGGSGGVAATGGGGLTLSNGGRLTLSNSGSVAISGSSTFSLQNSGASAVVLATSVPGRQGITVSGRPATGPVMSQSTREVRTPPIVQPAIDGVRRYGPTIFAPVPSMVVAPPVGLASAQVTLNLSKRESTF